MPTKMPKRIFIFLLIFFLALTGVVVFLLKPYEIIEEVRTSDHPAKVNAVFVNFTGDASCAKLYRYAGSNISAISSPIFPALPEEIPPPDEGLIAYSNNIFKLTGYEYQLVKKNLLTGSTVSQTSNRFDVISWEIVPPYKIWTEKTDKDGILLAETKSDLLAYSLSNSAYKPDLFRKGNYTDCSK
jgi:hypothetical protein